MPDFLEISEVSPSELDRILRNTAIIRDSGRHTSELLADKSVALIFEKPSTRTRLSFEVGVRQLGGTPIVLSSNEMQLGRGESIHDTAKVLSRFVDLIMIRTFADRTLRELAEFADIPVINGLTDESHPCQIMGDIFTYQEMRGSIAGCNVAWLGTGNNVCTSFLHAAGQMGFNMIFSGPRQFHPCENAVAFAVDKGVNVEFQPDPTAAVATADLIVTDTWISMHESAQERENIWDLLMRYQVNANLMSHSRPDALFMHCLPAHREAEVTSEVMDGPQSVVFDEAENRLHVQKSIMCWCLDLLPDRQKQSA